MNKIRNPVVIIGAGPGGLATAKALLDEGLEPIVLEQSSAVGGQWNTRADHSGIWPGMPTNTSKATTVFSDLAHDPSMPTFPMATDIQAYLERYADAFDLRRRIRFGATVNRVSRRDDGDFVIAYEDAQGTHRLQAQGVVVATGRNNRPVMPRIPGLDSFTGTVLHAFDYPGREAFAGQSVLVVGNSISGLEIPTDMARDPSIRIVSCCRKPRYIIQKTKDGVASDWRFFNRMAAYVGRTLPPEVSSAGLRDMVVQLFGNPADHGALRPSDNLMEAGLGQAQHYLECCRTGRISARTMPERIEGRQVFWSDGHVEAFDAILAGTGYGLNLPFLSESLEEKLNVGSDHLDLYDFTFAPTVGGLAFIGQFPQVGPYLPVLELQGRYVAMVFAGHHHLPDEAQRIEGARMYRKLREMKVPLTYHEVVLHLAEAMGVEPDPGAEPDLAAGLVFGPIVPTQFRLRGHGSRPQARDELKAALAGVGLSAVMTPDDGQLGMLRSLAEMPTAAPALKRAQEVIDEVMAVASTSPDRSPELSNESAPHLNPASRDGAAESRT